ncbi:MAG: type II secretion system F family protein [Dethiobacteria bacterium]|jgi:type IV pilus assembly protein PilC
MSFNAEHKHSPFFFHSRPKTRDLMTFCRQLAVLNAAGITFLHSLQLLGEQTEQPVIRERLRIVAARLESGHLLADSLAEHSDIFPDILLSMVRAGEEGGVLDTVLEQLARHFEKQYDLEQKIKTATFYPKFLVGVVFLIVIFILVFVLPNFMRVFENLGLEIPLLTKVFFSLGRIFVAHWYLLLLVLMIFCLILGRCLQTEQGAHLADRLRLDFPFFCSVYRKIMLARFCRILGTLLESGMVLLPALNLLQAVMENRIISANIKQVERGVVRGRSLAENLATFNFFPPMLVEKVHIGEQTGNLGHLLLKTAEFYEMDVSYAVSRLHAMLEPALILVMATIVTFIVLAVILPVFEIYQIL